MIFTNLESLTRYQGIADTLDEAIQLLQQFDTLDLTVGKHDYSSSLYYSVFEYVAEGVEGEFLEGHQQFLDMQIILEGQEKIGITQKQAAVEIVDPYDTATDFCKYHGPLEQVVTLKANDCLIVFPEDLHQPGIQVNQQKVKKLVVKVRISEL